MNLNISNWKEYKISDLFNVKYGVNLELSACEEVSANTPDSINFVARTAENNGVSARVKLIEGIAPQKAGLISVAGGGSVLSTFLQYEPFYSGRDLYVLESKVEITNEAKLFITTVIEQNKYKYSYGRQANKTLPDILLKLPANCKGEPDYNFMDRYIKSLYYKPLTTANKKDVSLSFDVNEWKDFVLETLFDIKRGESLYITDSEKGDVPYASASAENNGISTHLNIKPNRLGNCLSINYDGSVGDSYYHKEPFFASEKIVTATLKGRTLTPCIALFIATIIMKEKYRFSYGRKWTVESSLKKSVIKLPVLHNADGTPYTDDIQQYSKEGYVPDWEFMENYIKSLPYGDRI